MAVRTDINSKAFWNTYLRTAQVDAGETLGYRRNDQRFQVLQKANAIVPDMRPVVYNLPLFYQPPAAPCIDMSTHHHVTHVHLPAAPKSEKEEEQERADQAKCIGAILCGIAACVFGYAYNVYTRQQETMAKTQDLHAQVHDENWPVYNHEFAQRVHQVTEAQLEIDQLNTSRINNYALAALVFLISAGLIVAGGFIVAGALITAGELGLVVSGGIAAWNFGSHCNDDDTLNRHYQAIAIATATIFQNGFLELYTEQMGWNNGTPASPPPAYKAEEPLYELPPSAPPSAPEAESV